MSQAKNWRFCHKCQGLFYDRDNDKGRCAYGHFHEAKKGGFEFVLPSDMPAKGTTQPAWRYCHKCRGLFYDGFAANLSTGKGKCPASGSHEAKGSNYVLPHDLSGTNSAQPGWRYCRKCGGIFFEKAEIYSPTQAPPPDFGKRSCAAGGRHVAHGWNFVLPHNLPSALEFHPKPAVIPLGAGIQVSAHVIVRENGTYDFWGEINNPGSLDYTVKATAYVTDLTKQAYTFAKTTKKVVGTLSSGAPEEDWDENGNSRPNRDLIANWANIAASPRCDVQLEAKTQLGDFIYTTLGISVLSIIAILL